MKRILYTLTAMVLFCTCAYAQKGEKNYVIGFYNLENLFDTYDDPAKNDEEFLPEGKNKWTDAKYQKKLQNMAKVIRSMKEENGAWHALLGVSEIENRLVLEDLVMEPQIAEANYQIVHYDGPDRRGVDVALLYNPKVFTFLDSESIPFTFEGSSIDWIQSQEERDYFRTRDVLMVHGTIDGEHFAIYVAHLPSRIGGKGADLRSLGGEIMRKHSEKMARKYPGIKVVVMGDMNDDPQDDSMARWLGAVRKVEDVPEGGFFNPFWDMLMDGYGSLGYRDVWSIYDQVIPSETLVNAPEGTLKLQKTGKKGYYGVVFKRPFMVTQKGQYKNYPFRTFSNGKFMNGYSDHFPTYIVIGK